MLNEEKSQQKNDSQWIGFGLFWAVSILYLAGWVWWTWPGFPDSEASAIFKALLSGWLFLVVLLCIWLMRQGQNRSIQGVMVGCICVVVPALLVGLFFWLIAGGLGAGYGCCG
jgi:hypothetical protein